MDNELSRLRKQLSDFKKIVYEAQLAMLMRDHDWRAQFEAKYRFFSLIFITLLSVILAFIVACVFTR
jgi:hypothetical protein